MSPMMEQYLEVKKQYPDYLLFYRLGDFYEMFFDDALTASKELELTLTGRDCGEKERAPMCGVPFHSVDSYIGRLIEKGYKIVICEQMEDPALAKGLVKRDVVRVVTPGTLIETDLLPENKNNYLCSLYVEGKECAVCFADVSTAQIHATVLRGSDARVRLESDLGTYAPSEILCNLSRREVPHISSFVENRLSSCIWEDSGKDRFAYDEAARRVGEQFPEDGEEIRENGKLLICALGGLLDYITEMQKSPLCTLRELHIYHDGQFMDMDVNTRRNLELTETMRTKEKKGSLLWVLDKTQTAAGARLLRSWLEHPLLNVARIQRRQSAVGEMKENFLLREEFSSLLSGVLDMERLMTKIVYGSANARDLRAVASTLSVLPGIAETLGKCQSEEMKRILREFDPLEDIYAYIDAGIAPDPPFSVREGGMIADGYNKDIDFQRSIMKDSSGWIEKIAAEEREKTGIKTLRIGNNNVFGYYIEVTKSFLDQVPDHYIRKQTLVNCERYITQELKNMESTIFGARDRDCSMEYELFQKIRSDVAAQESRIRKTASLLAELDVYVSLGTVAAKNRYVRPEVDNGEEIIIKDGRHPVVEQFVRDSYFVPNDTFLDVNHHRLMLITGPNMAGKSTYMRQVALITIFAQIGSFVPAGEARIGMVDKIFTRVGASDDLASGQSTFLLEMNEVAFILKNATKRSLIIYDEVGRGTSTYDGMSIARAIVEFTAGKKIGAKTLFATHYHELTSLEEEIDGVVNYNVAAKKKGDSITFLRKIVRGSTDDSYGIEVAKLAGLPNEVIQRAKEVLLSVEKTARAVRQSESNEDVSPASEELRMEDFVEASVIEELKNTDINTLSPLEALTFLFDIKKRLE